MIEELLYETKKTSGIWIERFKKHLKIIFEIRSEDGLKMRECIIYLKAGS